jgi:gluconolactonase
VKSDGSIWFTDPDFGLLGYYEGHKAEAELPTNVYRVDGRTGRASVVIGDIVRPNGLCFSPDESLLYINDSPRGHIRVFDRKPDGTIANGRMFFDHIGTGVIADGIPDGMKIDAAGNVWVTGPGGIWVISPKAELLGRVDVPENVGNLNWGGDGWKTLFICASTSLYKIDTLVGGNRLPYMA